MRNVGQFSRHGGSNKIEVSCGNDHLCIVLSRLKIASRAEKYKYNLSLLFPALRTRGNMAYLPVYWLQMKPLPYPFWVCF